MRADREADPSPHRRPASPGGASAPRSIATRRSGRSRRSASAHAVRIAVLCAAVAALWTSPVAAEPRSDAAVGGAIARFSTTAARLLDGPAGRTAYFLEGTGPSDTPDVQLARAPRSAFTECSGWVNYVLASTAPLQQATLFRQRTRPRFNAHGLNEKAYGWSRAYVIYDFLSEQPADARNARNGFQRIDDFHALRAGDVVAWCLGGWCKPASLTRPPRGDTGHTFVVTDTPTRVPPEAPGYQGVLDGQPTLDTVPGRRVAKVIRVPVVDSSSIRHFHDSRSYGPVPKSAPRDAVPGGVGSGEFWIAVDAKGRPVQFRFARSDPYFPNPVSPQMVGFAAGRATGAVQLGGTLKVAPYRNAVSKLGGAPFGGLPVALGGRGKLTVLRGGSLVLTGQNSFHGAVAIERGATLEVRTDWNLGATDNPVLLDGTLTVWNGFASGYRRALRVPRTGTFEVKGSAYWGGKVGGKTLRVDVPGTLNIPYLGLSISGRSTVRLNTPASSPAAAPSGTGAATASATAPAGQ